MRPSVIPLFLFFPLLGSIACGPADEPADVDGGDRADSSVESDGNIRPFCEDAEAPILVTGTLGETLWTYPYVLQMEFSPAVAKDGTIVVQGKVTTQTPSGGDTVLAFDPQGEKLWGGVTNPGSVPAPPPTIHDCKVYAPGTYNDGELNSRLYRFDLASGETQTPIALSGATGDGLAVGADGTLYVPATELHAIVENDVSWTYSMVDGGKTGSNAAVGPSGTIYVGGRGINDHFLHAVTSDGTEKWKRDVGNAIIDPIAIDEEERIYSVSSGGLLSVYEATGDLAWSYQLIPRHGGGGMVIGPDKTVYLGTTGDTPGVYDEELLYAIREGADNQGELLWRTKVGLSWISATPALTEGGTLFVSDFCSSIIAVRASDGAQLWSYHIPGTVEEDICAGFSAPAIGDNGVVYAWNEGMAADGSGGGLYAFVGDGTGPAKSAWPQEGSNSAHTGLVDISAKTN